jgi:putative membrane protein
MLSEPHKGATDAVSTWLAFDRTRVAYDRTLMAWIRTATSLITFGFSIFKFFQLELGSSRHDNHSIGPREFALLMVGIGLASLVLGTVEHWRNMRSLKVQCLNIHGSRTGVLAVLILVPWDTRIDCCHPSAIGACGPKKEKSEGSVE